jgi:hypothetical protein
MPEQDVRELVRKGCGKISALTFGSTCRVVRLFQFGNALYPLQLPAEDQNVAARDRGGVRLCSIDDGPCDVQVRVFRDRYQPVKYDGDIRVPFGIFDPPITGDLLIEQLLAGAPKLLRGIGTLRLTVDRSRPDQRSCHQEVCDGAREKLRSQR